VVGFLAGASRPVVSPKAIKSVKVPPISIATSKGIRPPRNAQTVSWSDEQSRRQASLSLEPGERAIPAISRQGMGRAGARRRAALRVPDPGRRPGGPRLVDDPQQARQLPQGLRP